MVDVSETKADRCSACGAERDTEGMLLHNIGCPKFRPQKEEVQQAIAPFEIPYPRGGEDNPAYEHETSWQEQLDKAEFALRLLTRAAEAPLNVIPTDLRKAARQILRAYLIDDDE